MYFCLLSFRLEIYLNGFLRGRVCQEIFPPRPTVGEVVSRQDLLDPQLETELPWPVPLEVRSAHSWGQAYFSPFLSVSRSHVSWWFSQVFGENRLLLAGFGYHRYAEGLRSLEVMSVLRNAHQAARELA